MFPFPLKIKKEAKQKPKHLPKTLGIHTQEPRGPHIPEDVSPRNISSPPFEKIGFMQPGGNICTPPLFLNIFWADFFFNHSGLLFALGGCSPKQGGDEVREGRGVCAHSSAALRGSAATPRAQPRQRGHRISGDQVCASRKYQKGKLM